MFFCYVQKEREISFQISNEHIPTPSAIIYDERDTNDDYQQEMGREQHEHYRHEWRQRRARKMFKSRRITRDVRNMLLFVYKSLNSARNSVTSL